MSDKDKQRKIKQMEEHGMVYYIARYIFGPLFLMVATTLLVPLLWYTIEKLDGSYASLGAAIIEDGFWETFQRAAPMPTLYTVKIVAAFAIFEIILLQSVPGAPYKGPISESGHVPMYRDNAVTCYAISLATLFGLYFSGVFNVASVYDELGQIFTLLVCFAHVLCCFLYLKGAFFPSWARPGGSPDYGLSGNIIMDYFWGTELYPHIGSFDIKRFTNCRFGMMAWPVLLCIYALKQYELYGYVSSTKHFGNLMDGRCHDHVSLLDAMLVSVGIQLVYLTKFFIWETGYLATIDIMYDRLGYYIGWGVICYVPSIYTCCAMYLVRYETRHPLAKFTYSLLFCFVVAQSPY